MSESTSRVVEHLGRAKEARKINLPWATIVPVITLCLIFIAFSLMNEAFLTDRNLTNLSKQVAVNCILAFGMTVIILLGGIDLSVGSLLALGSVVAGFVQLHGMAEMGLLGTLLTILAVVAVCGSFGAFTGTMVAKFKMPPFVVSLGIFVIARGLALIVSGGTKFSSFSDSFVWAGQHHLAGWLSVGLIIAATAIGVLTLGWSRINALRKNMADKARFWWAQAAVAVALCAGAIWVFREQGLPVSVLIMLCVFGGIWFLLNKTVYGRAVYAIGGNPEAARLCGIRVPLVLFASFVLIGICVALSSIIETGRIYSGDPTGGQLYELDAIAAVVIGGTSLQGGVGRIQGTLLGAVLIGVLNNGMSLMNIPSDYQMVIKGMIIIGAVLIDVVSKKRG